MRAKVMAEKLLRGGKMSKRLVCSAVLFVLFVCASQVFAKGIFITPGARANAMGAAYIGIADDLTAIYWNPAGLSQLDKSGFEISAFYVSNDAKSNTSLKNAAIPDLKNGDFPILSVYPTEPAVFNSKEFKTNALIPFISGYTKTKGITLAFGFYGSGGGGGKWEDTVSDAITGVDKIIASVDGAYGFTVTNISASKEVCHNVSVGVGVDWINMTDKSEAKKDYDKSAASFLNGVNPALTSYNISTKSDASGSGFQFTGGVLYKPLTNLRTGLVVRSGSTLKLTGKATFTQSGLGAAGLPDVTFNTDFDKNYAYPLTYGIGAAYDPINPLTLALGIDVNNYSSMKDDITYKNPLPAVGFANVNKSSGWKDTTQLRLGAEYRLNEKLSFQGGVQTDPVPIPTDKLTLLELNQYNFNYICLGAGYKTGSIKINGTYAQGVSDKPEIDGRTYEYPLNIFRVAASYSF